MNSWIKNSIEHYGEKHPHGTCYVCGEGITYLKSKSKQLIHTNICQEPEVKNFCSFACRNKFIFHRKNKGD